MNTRRSPHELYEAMLARGFGELSPMHPVPTPFEIGGRTFFCVEGIWQGTKIVRIADIRRATLADLPHEVLEPLAGATDIWFPELGRAREDISRTLLFRCLKSGAGYDPKRNRFFGRDNWSLVGHWHPARKIRLTTAEARRELHEPFYRAQLAQFPEVVARLRAELAAGTVELTPEMLELHPHFGMLVADL